MEAHLEITDVAIWFKHAQGTDLLKPLEALEPGSEIELEADGVKGRWKRMKTGVDGRKVNGIVPVGPMKGIWNEWFKTRKGDRIYLRVVEPADDYLAAASVLFSEWNSPEDDEAFRDL